MFILIILIFSGQQCFFIYFYSHIFLGNNIYFLSNNIDLFSHIHFYSFMGNNIYLYSHICLGCFYYSYIFVATILIYLHIFSFIHLFSWATLFIFIIIKFSWQQYKFWFTYFSGQQYLSLFTYFSGQHYLFLFTFISGQPRFF